MVGNATAPDYIYYNADIINNNTTETADGNVVRDPQVRFNETRDTALLKNAQDYYFSIVRFSMNGPNRDLPLFIPTIQNGTGAVNVNLTSYAVALSYSQSWNTTDKGVVSFNIVPVPQFIIYVPETQNTQIAPTPKSLASPQFRGLFNIANTYQPGDIVSQTFSIFGNFNAPFYQVQQPGQIWQPTFSYGVGAYVSYQGLAYRAVAPPVVGVAPPLAPGVWVVGVSGILPTTAPYWGLTSNNQGSNQDLSSRYYWVYTYQHWVNLVNTTLATAHFALFQAFQNAWANTGTADPFPFAGNYQGFQNYVNIPQMVYDKGSRCFKIYGDSDGYGTRITAFVPTPAPAPIPHQTPPVFRLFFNANMYGLFANYDNYYWNFTDANDPNGPFGGATILDNTGLPITTIPPGYTNEILFTNKFWQNVEDYRLPPFSGVLPLGYVPPNGFTGAGVIQQKPYWVAEQDFPSTDSLWSPISSLVFTSTLLPVRAEATGQPVVLGTGNTNFSAATSQSAFQPIITDISLDTSSAGAEAYKTFIYYAPAAEYRLSDFTSSKQDIRNIDIQVYWKNRLDNQLYPITMFNLSSVSLKVMFRHKDAHTAGTT